MKDLTPHKFNPAVCRKELNEFLKLLSSKEILDEQKHILPFFKERQNISMLISEYIPDVKSPNVVNHEYGIQGHFQADLIVGDTDHKQYLLVEFENGAPDSIFRKIGKKATLEWSPRFEHSFSQIVDWMWMLEDMRSTSNFGTVFRSRSAKFYGLLILGRKGIKEVARLNWRMDRVIVDSHKLSCVTFDQLYEDLNFFLKKLYGK